MTALPMMITEELQCDWSKVRIEYASPNRNLRENKVYGPMFSNGSRSVRASQKMMQQVGASARERLIAAAAARWNVPTSECTAAASVVTHQTFGPDAALWRARRRRGEDYARQRTRDQNAGSVHLHPQTDAARRRGAQDRRLGQVRHRRAGSGHGFRRHHGLPRPGGKLKSVDDSVLAGAPGIVQVVKLEQCGGGGRNRQLLARQAGTVPAAARVGCRRRRQRRQRAAFEGIPRGARTSRC